MTPQFYSSKRVQLLIADPSNYRQVLNALKAKFWVQETENQDGEPMIILENARQAEHLPSLPRESQGV